MGLIERFYNVSQGAIYLGNQDLKDIKISSLRSKIAYVSQEGSMFNDTIKNNIMFGNQDADFGQVKRLLKMLPHMTSFNHYLMVMKHKLVLEEIYYLEGKDKGSQ